MNPDTESKLESSDPETSLRLLELELMQQRSERQRGGKPFQGLRALSLLFLAAVILGALFAFYYLFSSGRFEEFRNHSNRLASPSQSTNSGSP